MLWIPDIVAGAVGGELDHGYDYDYVERIRSQLTIVEIGLT